MTMTAVPKSDTPVDESGLTDVVDDALIARLAGQARARGVSLVGEGGLLQQLTNSQNSPIFKVKPTTSTTSTRTKIRERMTCRDGSISPPIPIRAGFSCGCALSLV
jgi:hypothetical protein